MLPEKRHDTTRESDTHLRNDYTFKLVYIKTGSFIHSSDRLNSVSKGFNAIIVLQLPEFVYLVNEYKNYQLIRKQSL